MTAVSRTKNRRKAGRRTRPDVFKLDDPNPLGKRVGAERRSGRLVDSKGACRLLEATLAAQADLLNLRNHLRDLAAGADFAAMNTFNPEILATQDALAVKYRAQAKVLTDLMLIAEGAVR